jgi:hypothetical protein
MPEIASPPVRAGTRAASAANVAMAFASNNETIQPANDLSND